jgi:hypothetical protein
VLQPDLILLNDDDTGYVIVRFDQRSLETVLSSVGRLPDLSARAVCWNAIVDMVRQAELPAAEFAATLAGAMRSEPSPPVLSAAAPPRRGRPSRRRAHRRRAGGGPVRRRPTKRRRLPGRDPRRRAQGGSLAAPDR